MRQASSTGKSRVVCRPLAEVVSISPDDALIRNPSDRQYFFIRRGGGKVRFDGREVDLNVGTFLVIPANCDHSLDWRPGTDGLYFSSSELFLRTRVAEAILRSPIYFWDSYYRPTAYTDWEGDEKQGKREQVFGELTEVSEHLGRGYDEILMAYILLVLAEDSMGARLSTEVPSLHLKTTDTEILYRFQVLVEKHFRQHFTVEDYCRILGVDQGKLKSICKYFSGSTPLYLIQKRVLLEAKRELRDTSKTVSQIAFELGFLDAGYFSRYFKKHSGLSPANFRAVGNPEFRKGDYSI